MSVSNKRILIVTGNYNLIERLRQIMPNGDYAIQFAYSHNDSLYSLETNEFDVVMVDASMTSHVSGEVTLVALAQNKRTLPFIGLIANSSLPRIPLSENVIISTLSDNAILRSLTAALSDLSLSGPADSAEKDDTLQLAEEIRTLFALSQSLTEVLELSEVLNRVVEAARRLTNAEEGMILLPDDEAGQLYLRAKVGIDIEVARNFRVKTEDTLAGRVFSTGQPVLIGAQGPQKVKTEYLVNALLYVPILYKSRCIGVLGVNNKNTQGVFHQRHQELLMNLASFAAVAIENARIHEETLERTRELQALVEASQAINSSLSLDKTLITICEQLVRILNVNRAEIYEWNLDNHQLRAQARYFRTIWSTGQGPSIDLNRHPLLQTALDNNRSTVINHNPATPSTELEYLRQLGVEVIQAVPLSGGSQALGMVSVYYVHAPARLPDAETLQRVQQLALETLVTLSNQATLSRQSIFRVIDDINHLTDADWCELALLTPDKQLLSTSVAAGQSVWLNMPQPYLDLTNHPDITEALATQTPINKQADSKILPSGVRALLDTTQSRTLLGLPLIQRGQTHGLVIFADSRRNRVFDQHDVDLGRTVTAQAATALENARLVHDLERSLKELRETQDRLVQTARLSAMGELAAAVAHQINNPLTTIMVDSELLLLDAVSESPNYKSLQAISRAGKRAAGVARRLLAIARPTDPDAPAQALDVVESIEGILSLVKSHIERDHIHIVTQLPEDRLPSIWAVPGQLDDIWLNLVMNAHDALMGCNNAQIHIAAALKPSENCIEVTVSDNGPGIPTEIIDEVFKPFFTTKPVGEGTGLGLHICRQTVERMGGSISVTSIPGKGTRFFVKLPLKKGGEL